MFILSLITISLELSGNHVSIWEKSELKEFFKNKFFRRDIISEMIYLEQRYTGALNRVENHCRQHQNEVTLLYWFLIWQLFTISIFSFLTFSVSQ